jgi:hypothetical protein
MTRWHLQHLQPTLGRMISGVALADIGKVRPMVFDGASGVGSADHAVALHVELDERDDVSVDIVNLFQRGDGVAIGAAH